MSLFDFFFNSPVGEYNTVVQVPKCTISVAVYKKQQEYVPAGEEPTGHECDKGLFDRCTSAFRPKTPPALRRIVKKIPLKKLVFIVYKKRRLMASSEIDYYYYYYYIDV